MNSWKLNSIAAHVFRQSVCRSLAINHMDIYKTLKDVNLYGIIETKDGKKYQLVLKEL